MWILQILKMSYVKVLKFLNFCIKYANLQAKKQNKQKKLKT